MKSSLPILMGAVLAVCVSLVPSAPADAQQAVAAAAGSPAPAVLSTESAKKPSPALPYVQAIRDAADPSAAVAAYAAGFAADRANSALHLAYVSKMVDFGMPGMALHQANLAVALEPTSGLPYAVQAFASARRGQMVDALTAIARAADLAPDNTFVQQVAGELLAWYDRNFLNVDVPDNLLTSLQKAHSSLSSRQTYAQAFDGTRKALAQEALAAAAGKSSDVPAASPAPSAAPRVAAAPAPSPAASPAPATQLAVAVVPPAGGVVPPAQGVTATPYVPTVVNVTYVEQTYQTYQPVYGYAYNPYWWTSPYGPTPSPRDHRQHHWDANHHDGHPGGSTAVAGPFASPSPTPSASPVALRQSDPSTVRSDILTPGLTKQKLATDALAPRTPPPAPAVAIPAGVSPSDITPVTPGAASVVAGPAAVTIQTPAATGTPVMSTVQPPAPRPAFTIEKSPVTIEKSAVTVNESRVTISTNGPATPSPTPASTDNSTSTGGRGK